VSSLQLHISAPSLGRTMPSSQASYSGDREGGGVVRVRVRNVLMRTIARGEKCARQLPISHNFAQVLGGLYEFEVVEQSMDTPNGRRVGQLAQPARIGHYPLARSARTRLNHVGDPRLRVGGETTDERRRLQSSQQFAMSFYLASGVAWAPLRKALGVERQFGEKHRPPGLRFRR